MCEIDIESLDVARDRVAETEQIGTDVGADDQPAATEDRVHGAARRHLCGLRLFCRRSQALRSVTRRRVRWRFLGDVEARPERLGCLRGRTRSRRLGCRKAEAPRKQHDAQRDRDERDHCPRRGSGARCHRYSRIRGIIPRISATVAKIDNARMPFPVKPKTRCAVLMSSRNDVRVVVIAFTRAESTAL